MTSHLVKKIVRKILDKRNNNIAIIMHNKPDGDSIGSAVALESALKKIGKKSVDLIIHDKINDKFSPIVGKDRVGKFFFPPKGKKYDLSFMIDFSNPERTMAGVKRLSKYIIVIDHHIYNKSFGDIYFCEPVSATGILVYNIIKEITPITPNIATSLYMSIRSDTGSFKNPNTDSLSHFIVAKLIDLGANIDVVNTIYEAKSKEFISLLGKTLQFVEYDSKYNIAYLIVLRKTIKASSVLEEEVSLLVDQIRGIKDVDIAYLFVEGIDNVRISARSRHTPINEILGYFGGGGHPKASGCAVEGIDILGVSSKVLATTRKYIDSLK